MNSLADFLFLTVYRLLVLPVALSIVLIGSLFHQKLRKGLKMRLPTFGHNPWLDLPKDRRPIWIHVSSGEFEYAKPLIAQLKAQHPEIPVLVTYFSPTYRKTIENFPGVDMSCPLPWDLPGPVASFLRHHRPRALMIARTDLWPEVLYQCDRRRIPKILFSASRPRLRWTHKTFKPFFYWLYHKLDQVYCVTESDRENLLKLGATHNTRAVGDTRYDQVLERLKNPKPLKENIKQNEAAPCLVAGSTWDEDEAVVLPALANIVRSGRLRLIIAPHEPSEPHIRHLLALISKNRLEACFYSKAHEWKPEHVLIIDQVGILAELYQWGDMAFVGGSFKGSVHSVMEPLAAGCLTFVGPFHQNNREAMEFQRLPLSLSTIVTTVKSDLELHDQVQMLVQEQDSFPVWKASIRDEVMRRTGATERMLQSLDEFGYLNR